MKMNVQCNFSFFLIWRIYIYIYNSFKYPARWQKLLGSNRSGSTALSYRNCVITPGWRLIRAGYRICFHTFNDENIYIYIYILAKWVERSLIVRETAVQSQVESYQRLKKSYLMPTCRHSIIKYGSTVKWSNLARWNNYWKGRLWVSLN